MKHAIQKGFTLIELVVVIVILGILAAVAIPQFTDLSTSARAAVGDAACGAVQSTAVLLYASNKAGTTGSIIANSTAVSGGAWTSEAGCIRHFTPTNGVATTCTAIPTAFCTG